MKKINLLIMFVLLVALMGAGLLVTKNQQLQRGASYANVEALFLPTTSSVKVGEKVTTTLMMDLKTHFLTGADLKIKYDSNNLELEEVTVLTPENFTTGVPMAKSMEEVLVSEKDNQKGTYNLVWTSISEPNAELASGVVGVVKLTFRTKAVGKVAVSLDNTYENILSGYNKEGSDQELGVVNKEEAMFYISGEVINEPTKIKPSRIPTKYIKPTLVPVKKIQIPM
jgi:hypothetical protein